MMNNAMMHFRRCRLPFEAFGLGLVLTGLGLIASLWAHPVNAQPIVYSEDFNDGQAQGWQLDSSWQVGRTALNARGRGLARYRDASWENLNLTFLFDTSNKGMQANIRVSDSGRYGVGFRVQRGFLHVYLFKETPVSGPNSFRNLAQRRIPLRTAQKGYRAEITAQDDTIAVSVNGVRALSVRDPRPLPAGTIAFESLSDSTALVDDVAVRAERSWVRVPALIGKPLGEARDRLKEADLVAGQPKERPADARQGLIVDQHPPEGERVSPGTTVNLVVSAGPQQVEVPRLIGMKRGEALRVIRESGLKAGAIRQGDSARDDVLVVDQNPAPGTRVASGSSVSITVAGKELVEVPRVVDKTLRMARETVEASRLTLGEVAKKASDAAQDIVLDQQPKPGARVASGSPVQLWVSSGPATSGAEVEVPRLTGRKRSEAGTILSQARLELGKVHEKASSDDPETVVLQDPAPGTRVRPRSSVDLWVSVAANQVSVPDVVRQDVRQARSMLEAAGLQLGKVSEHGSSEKEGAVLDQMPPPGKQVERGTSVSVSVAGKGGGAGWTGWFFTAVVAALLGVLGGYWGGRGFGDRRGKMRQPAQQITVRVLKDPGSQSMEGTGPIVGKAFLRCRVIPDAGKQMMDIPGTAQSSNEDEHVG
jgi:beta-lactam-binding protein with PASTA domain